MRVVWVRLAIAMALLSCAGSIIGSGLDGPISFVPWKVLAPGEVAPAAPMVLYWIPSSPDDFKHSDLIVSRSLTIDASQCIAMRVIRPDDSARIAAFGGPALPVVILVDGDGATLGMVAANRGTVSVRDVERLVHEKLVEREMLIQLQLDKARKEARSGNRQSAIDGYRTVWDQRCLFPRPAREAARALKRLGVQ